MAYGTIYADLFEQYESNTIREDLSDVITIASPIDTPFLSSLPQIGVHATTYDWPVDHIEKPTGRLASPEGADANDPGANDIKSNRRRLRLANVLQINRGFVDVSETQRAMLMAGVDDEFSYQIWKRMLEVAKQIEFQLHYGDPNSPTSSTGGTVDRQTAGFIHWAFRFGVSTHAATNLATATAKEVGPNLVLDVVGAGDEVYKPTWFSGAPADISRAILNKSILRPFFQGGGTVGGSVIHMSTRIKRLLADMALLPSVAAPTESINRRTIPANLHQLIDVIDIYSSEFGDVYFNIDRYMDEDFGIDLFSKTSGENTVTIDTTELIFGYQSGVLEIAVLRPLQFLLLAKIGDNTKGMLVMEYGTKVHNPRLIYGGDGLAVAT